MNSVSIPAFFIGCVQSSEIALRALLGRSEISVRGIMTLRKSSFNSDFADLTEIADDYGVPVYFGEEFDDPALAKLISELGADVVFTIGWSRLLGPRTVATPKHGVIGYHPAALPRNRGRHPLIWALALGLNETASTFFVMDEGADSGPIVSQKAISINQDDDAGSLYDKITAVIPEQLTEIVSKLASGSLVHHPQDHELASSWRKRGQADGLIDWRMPAQGVYNLVRALSRPYVGAEFSLRGDTVKLWRCEVVETPTPIDAEPGKVLECGGRGVVVKTGIGAVRLLEFEGMLDLRTGDYL